MAHNVPFARHGHGRDLFRGVHIESAHGELASESSLMQLKQHLNLVSS